VITSLNLYDFSEQNNREMGVLVAYSGEIGHVSAQIGHPVKGTHGVARGWT